MSLALAMHLDATSREMVSQRVARNLATHCLTAIITTLALVSNSFAGNIAYAHPWKAGDLIVNMNGNEVTAARADSAGFEIGNPSAASTILTKQDFKTGHVTQRDPHRVSDLFVTAKGDAGGTLYRINIADGSVEAINENLGVLGPQAQLGITSDGTGLYIYDGQNNIDKYSFDGELIADDLITGVGSGGFTGTNQLHYWDGFVFIATGGMAVQAAPTTGGVAAAIWEWPNSSSLPPPGDIAGVWVGDGYLFTSDSSPSRVYAFDVDTSGTIPTLSNPVLEGERIGGGGAFGGLSVDLAARKIFVGEAGSFSAGASGLVVSFDFDGDLEEHNVTTANRNVVTNLPAGGLVGVYRVSGVPEPSSSLLLLAAIGIALGRNRIS